MNIAVIIPVLNEEPVLASDRHELKTFGPTGNHAVHGKHDRGAGFVRALERRPVDERTGVVHADLIRCGSLGTGTFLQDLILQAGGRRCDAVPLSVLGKECFTGPPVPFGESRISVAGRGLGPTRELLEHRGGLGPGQQRRVTIHQDRKSTRLNSSHTDIPRMPYSA